MRRLTKRQKKFLCKIFKEKGVTSVRSMSSEDWRTVRNMNDFETIWSWADNYLQDLVWERELC